MCPPSECVEEQITQHHRGVWCGFGPVCDSEHVTFAVFANTKRKGSKLSSGSFSSNLRNRTQSLARASYVSRDTFDNNIVRQRILDGVAIADVREIRNLRADLQTSTGIVNVRAISVIDLVEPGDCDGHATMGYATAMNIDGVSERQLGKKREFIKKDLADVFSEIRSPRETSWPSTRQISLRRLAHIIRILAHKATQSFNAPRRPALPLRE